MMDASTLQQGEDSAHRSAQVLHPAACDTSAQSCSTLVRSRWSTRRWATPAAAECCCACRMSTLFAQVEACGAISVMI